MTEDFDKPLKKTSSFRSIKTTLLANTTGRIALLLGSLLVVAFVLRVWGLGFGLPYRYHIDETFYVALSLSLPSNNFEMPIITHGPNLFYLILLSEYVLYYLTALVTGQVSSIAAFEQLYRTDPTNFVLLARITSAVAGTLTLIPTYLLGKRLYNRPLAGLVAAALLGFTFQHIRESHYGTPDIFVGLLVTITLLECLNILNVGRLRDYVLAGAFAGLAAGTKFTNVLVWIPLLLAHIYRAWKERSKRNWLVAVIASPGLWVSIAVFIIAFVIAYPNLAFRPGLFLEYTTFLISIARTGFIPQFIIDPAPAWFYYLFSLSWGMGWLLLGIVILAIALALVRREPGEIFCLVFVFIYLIFLARAPYYASRYLVPLLPLLCVFGAHGILWLGERLQKRLRLSSTAVVAIITLLVLIQPVSSAVRHNYLLGQTDTRTLAKTWIEENIPEGTGIAVDWRLHAPPLRTQYDAYPESTPQYKVIEAGGIGLPERTVDSYYADGVRYVVVSSFIDSLRLASPDDVTARRSFHEALDEATLVYEVEPSPEPTPSDGFIFDQIFGPAVSLWQIERPGPSLQIYQLAP